MLLEKTVVREMKLEDIEIINQNFLNQGWGDRKEVLRKYFREQESNQRYVLVGEYQNEVAGYLTIVDEASEGPFKGEYPEIVDFNVFESFQQQGMGSLLLFRAEELVKEFSKIITLGVGLHPSYGSAQRLYIKNGFIPDGSGIWFENQRLSQDEACINNDDLVLYLVKRI